MDEGVGLTKEDEKVVMMEKGLVNVKEIWSMSLVDVRSGVGWYFRR